MKLADVVLGAAGRKLVTIDEDEEPVVLQPPASPARVAEIEREIGFALPSELRDLLGMEAQAREHLSRARLDLVAAELLVVALHLAEARQDRVHLVRARGVGERVLERRELRVDRFDLAVQFRDLALPFLHRVLERL